MDKMANLDEMVSALADGQLKGDEFARTVDALAGDDHARASWQAYHLVGDVLRSSELASPSDGTAFVDRFRARLRQEPAGGAAVPADLPVHDGHGAPVHVTPRPAPANAPAFAWPLVAGVATLTAVTAIVWNVMGLGNARPGTELARATPAQTTPVQPQQQARAEPTQTVMIRDARLDELLAAHRESGGASALQMPSGFLRNATFESTGR